MAKQTQDIGLDTAPRYRHSGCNACVFLGHQGIFDLYACLKEPTFIARQGEDGDYKSGDCFAYGANTDLTEARRRAQIRGIVKYDLQAGVHHTPRTADEKSRDELKAAITQSPDGKALMLLGEDNEEGKRRLSVLIEAAALGWQAKHPDRSLEELRSWHHTYLHKMHQWMGVLGLLSVKPAPDLTDLGIVDAGR